VIGSRSTLARQAVAKVLVEYLNSKLLG